MGRCAAFKGGSVGTEPPPPLAPLAESYQFPLSYSLHPTTLTNSMDFLPYHTSSSPFLPPPPSSPSSQPSSRQPPSSSSPSSTTSRGWARGRAMASELLGKICSAIVACIFAVVGSVVGAVTGALIGLATESGLFRGAGIGAISGAVFSIEAVESSLAMWRSDGPGIWSVLFVIDIFLSLFSGRLVREKVGPAMQSAVQSQVRFFSSSPSNRSSPCAFQSTQGRRIAVVLIKQMNAIDQPFQEVLDIFETGGTRGMSQDSIDRLPKISITDDNSIDGSGSRACCSVCLQDFQVGERVRSLPHCQHMFHLQCIDLWLLKHGSCPLCRRDF